MRAEPTLWRRAWRGLGLLVVGVAGVVTLVGSGGGAVGFPDCGPPLCSDAPPLVLPAVSVQPPALTAQVGSAARFTAVPSNLSGTLSYQWRRSSDGGTTYVDIAGATAATLTLPAVNLADDQLKLRVDVRSSSGLSANGSAQLAVSASPGIVFGDGEFVPAEWLTSPLPDPEQLPFTASDQRMPDGGNPGAWRTMAYTIPAGAGWARLFYARPAAVYAPASQGAIYVIDYAEDCIALNPSEITSIASALTIEQGTRRYLWNVPESCTQGRWTAGMGRASLAASAFSLVDGPACGAGERCPDFSVNAAPLRFGYRRVAFGVAGDTIAHGIDNWRVTVWRR